MNKTLILRKMRRMNVTSLISNIKKDEEDECN